MNRSIDRKIAISNMDNLLNSVPSKENNSEAGNLWQYVQSMNRETVAQLSKPQSPEVLQVIEHNISALLGNLPPADFGVMITTSREHLGRLLASAMLNGYFLRNLEQRVAIEKSLLLTETNVSDPN